MMQKAESKQTLPDQALDGAEIETRNLTKRFGKREVVRGVGIRVPRGSTYGFIGLNGSGKSTTIRMMLGLLPADGGSVFIRGCDPARRPVQARTGVGYVPDRPTAYAWMRVGQVIEFCRNLQPNWNDSIVDGMLTKYRIDPRQKVGRLSKGMCAKLSLMLAIGHDPDVLILDEPTDGLDPLSREEFLGEVLGAACERERTVLMSSHSLTDIQNMADVVGLIHDGRLLVQCPTEELVSTTKRIRAVLEEGGTPGEPPPGTVYQRVIGREWTVTVRGFTRETVERLRAAAKVGSVDVMDLSLDEVFKDFVRGQVPSAAPISM